MRKYFLGIIFLCFLCGNSAFGYTINDNTLVGKGQTSSKNVFGLTDVIGDGFDIKGIDLTLNSSILGIDIFSDFDGTFNEGNLSLVSGDLFINLDGNNSNGVNGYELAVAFTTRQNESFVMGNIYNVAGAVTSKYLLENTPGWYYGEYLSQGGSPIVQISEGAYTGFQTGLSRNESEKLWSLSIDLAAFNFDYSNEIGFFWATATCGNDIIEGSAKLNPVPEPATMLLLGAGLVGLAGFGRKRLMK